MPVFIEEISAEVEPRERPEREEPEVEATPPAQLQMDMMRRQLLQLDERRARLRAD
ncbi:MAG: hypothetical protein HC802_07645 [Caldilineaceae bacterium]|nr:hypothetical protein [Caldilineaceae bacterium]